MRKGPLTIVSEAVRPSAVNPQVLDALYAIRTTSYENSFHSRIEGTSTSLQKIAISVDWETRTPWMELMSDIREHHSLFQ